MKELFQMHLIMMQLSDQIIFLSCFSNCSSALVLWSPVLHHEAHGCAIKEGWDHEAWPWNRRDWDTGETVAALRITLLAWKGVSMFFSSESNLCHECVVLSSTISFGCGSPLSGPLGNGVHPLGRVGCGPVQGGPSWPATPQQQWPRMAPFQAALWMWAVGARVCVGPGDALLVTLLTAVGESVPLHPGEWLNRRMFNLLWSIILSLYIQPTLSKYSLLLSKGVAF